MARGRVDKLVVTNLSVLRRKYGRGWPRVETALRALVRADGARGLTTLVVGVDDARALDRLGLAPVVSVADCRGHKRVVDGLWREYRPDYVMLLGAVDVIPHQDLRNPAYDPPDDDDRFAWGDLPYACDAPYSRNPRDFRAPSRVLGRLPDVTGLGDARYLVRLLGLATRFVPRPRREYQAHFGLSTQSWRASTALSLTNLFGSADALQTSPPGGPRWSRAALRRRAHFINCHGAHVDFRFYGENAAETVQPTALSALFIGRERRVREGTVVAAECCFGAELYDPRQARGHVGICNTYLYHGAYGFFGSSTIAYGPPDGNGSADLICQYFLERVLRGASLGRAALEARLQFVRAASVLDPVDLKTLAQFSLLGDPSVQPIGRAPHALARSRAWSRVFPDRDGGARTRRTRREWIVRHALAADDVTGATGRKQRRAPRGAVRDALEVAARGAGVRAPRFSAHAVTDPVRARIKRRLGEPRTAATVHLAVGSRRSRGGERRTVMVLATVENGRVAGMRLVESR
jgi:hypothetical protein